MKRSPLARGSKGLTRKTYLEQTQALARATGLHPAGNGLSRSKPLAAKSPKRIEEDAEDGAWFRLRAFVLARDVDGSDRCVVADRWPEVSCGGIPDAHHIRRTGAGGGPRLADPRDMLGICRYHHDAIHLDTHLAKARGLLRDSPYKPPEDEAP